jgi:hypothetical protein
MVLLFEVVLHVVSRGLVVTTGMFSPCQCIDVPSSSEFLTVIEIMSP